MSQKELNQVNKVYRSIVKGIAVVVAIVAIIYNPAHLLTAGVVYLFALDSELVKSDEFDLR